MALFPSLVYCSARTSRTDRVPLTDELHLFVYVWEYSLHFCNEAHLIGICQCFIRSLYIYVHQGDCLEFSLLLCLYLGFGVLERVWKHFFFHVLNSNFLVRRLHITTSILLLPIGLFKLFHLGLILVNHLHLKIQLFQIFQFRVI